MTTEGGLVDDANRRLADAYAGLFEAPGEHADEVETSMMLYIAPSTVDMNKAVKDLNPDVPGPLTRNPHGKGLYSPTGTWGDPTLATLDKGKIFTEALVAGILNEIEETRHLKPP